MNNEYITPKEASKITGLHPVTLRRWANQGKIEHIKITNGDRRYNKKSLYELLNIPIENNKEKVFYIRSSNGNKTLLETQ